MRWLVIAIVLLTGCVTAYDMKIHRMDGKLEKIEATYKGGPPVHSVCKETAVDVFGRTLECRERHLN